MPIREYILFGSPFDNDRYDQIVRSCGLDKDFELLPEGDQTMAGLKGLDLDYDMKIRINLARAIYADPHVLIVDDLFARMEHDKRKQIFKEIFLDRLKFKTRIMVSQHKEFLEHADRVVCLQDGQVFATGTLSEVQQIPEVNEILQNSRNKQNGT